MSQAGGGKEPPEFLSDHPSDEDRVEDIKGWLPEAEREYDAASDGT
jgi:Zn-dependent protease with chaperone function